MAAAISASSAFGSGSLQEPTFLRNRVVAASLFPPSSSTTTTTATATAMTMEEGGGGGGGGGGGRRRFNLFSEKRTPSLTRKNRFTAAKKVSTAPAAAAATFLGVMGGSATTAAAAALTGGGGGAVAAAAAFDNGPLVQFNSVILGLNGVGFVMSLLTGSHLHLDLLGTGAFAVAALPTLLSHHLLLRVKLSAAAVALWGTKLAGFLFYRALQVKHDGRLDDTLSTVSGTALFWSISTAWGSICSLPHALGSTSSASGNPIALGIGGAMYVVGLVMETMADYQKWRFKQSNPGKFCTAGLWSVSQHPNFFGNLLLWSGILVMNADSLVVESSTNGSGGAGLWNVLWSGKRLWLALLSPLFLWTLFYGQATGSVSNAVELANKKYGKDVDYQRYIKSVPLIIPNFFKRFKTDK